MALLHALFLQEFLYFGLKENVGAGVVAFDFIADHHVAVDEDIEGQDAGGIVEAPQRPWRIGQNRECEAESGLPRLAVFR